MRIFDTTGNCTVYERLRPLSYPQTDVFLLCFSVDDPNSFHNIRAEWVPEITHHCPQVNWVLVGTKTDLREDLLLEKDFEKSTTKLITRKQGEVVARSLSTKNWKVPYIECSSITRSSLPELLELVSTL